MVISLDSGPLLDPYYKAAPSYLGCPERDHKFGLGDYPYASEDEVENHVVVDKDLDATLRWCTM